MLVVCPSSLKKQWGKEAHKFLDENHIDSDLVTVIDGTKSQRKKLYEKAEDSFITILNYSLLYYDFDKIQELNPDILTLDEAHYIKNRDSKRTKLIKKIDSNYRYAMTGTPIQNKPDELYSIVEFLDKDYFGSYTSFKKEYVVYGYDYGHPVLRGYVNFDQLGKQVAPIMMRRRLKDVKGQLPEATFTNRYVQPTPLQKRLYKQIQEEQEELDEEIKELRQSKNNSVGRKKGLESELRKVEAELNSTDEPNDKLISRKNNLISEISKISNIINSIQDDLDQKEGASQGKNALALGVSDGPELLTMSESYMVRNNYDVTDFKSPKLIELKKIVTEFIDMDYKVIVFSRLAKMVKLIKRELSDITRVATLYGAKSSKERDDAVKMFENDPFCGVIAMSDAGAEG
jgi:SNF2 family DNA or RNA helicase